MTLSEYIAETKVTETEIASRAGLSQPTINRIRHGIGNPSADVLKRITSATDGKVTWGDFAHFGRAQPTETAGDAI